MSSTRSLFQEFPDGFRYQEGFITAAEESEAVAAIQHIEFSNFELRGVVARRRVAFFGRTYGRSVTALPMPEFLLGLRRRAAAWVDSDESAFVMALVNEYSPGAPIGWHRDAPQYDIVVGLSLLSTCRMLFRPYVSPAARTSGARRAATHEIELEPRSAYLLAGQARTDYEHHIPAVAGLRYSITFRTARA